MATMTPAIDKIRELETGLEAEQNTRICLLESATPISDFLELYENSKTCDNYRLAIGAFLRHAQPRRK